MGRVRIGYLVQDVNPGLYEASDFIHYVEAFIWPWQTVEKVAESLKEGLPAFGVWADVHYDHYKQI